MPPAKQKTQGRPIAAKAGQVSGKIKAERLAKSGYTTRVRGHLLASGKRAQSRRDSR